MERHSLLVARLRPLDAVCVCRLLGVFLVHAGITISVQIQFIPGPIVPRPLKHSFQPVYPKGYVFTVFWGLHTIHHGVKPHQLL